MNRKIEDHGMGPGWKVYGPPQHEEETLFLQDAIESLDEDCRYFVKIARTAQMDCLHEKWGLSWEEFCERKLRKPAERVEALIAGVRVLGEDFPVPRELAERVGVAVLNQREHGILGGKPGPGRGKKTGADSTRFSGNRSSTGVEYLRARLARDRADLLARVDAGELSANAAAIEAGWRSKPTPLAQLERAWGKASESERAAFATRNRDQLVKALDVVAR